MTSVPALTRTSRPRLLAAAVLCLGVALAGCTGEGAGTRPSAVASGTDTTSGASRTATQSPTGPVTLRFAVFGDDAAIEGYRDMAHAFMKDHPDVTVVLEQAPTSGALVDDLGAGSGPDVFLIEHEQLPALVANHRVHPVDQLLEARQVNFGDGFQRAGLEAFSSDSSLQCMPHDVSPLVVYYNRDLVDLRRLAREGEDPVNAEDGWSWEQFVRAAAQAAHGKVKGAYLEPELDELAPFVWSGGGELVDDRENPSTLTLSDGDSQAAIEQVLTLARDPQLTPTPAELDRLDAVQRFRRGRLAMMLGYRELTPELRKAESLDFDVMPLPHLGPYRTITDMTGYCISADTDQLQTAADFLAFATGREGATLTAITGHSVPANLQVAHSPAFIQPGRDPRSSFVFTEGVRRADWPPLVPQWPQLESSVAPLLERAFYAPVIDLDTLLADIDAASQPILAPSDLSAD